MRNAALPRPGLRSPAREAGLRGFLQMHFRDYRETSPDARYAAALVDLNGDGRPEAVVQVFASSACGSGGCNLHLFGQGPGGWHMISTMTVANAPIRALNTRSHGWRDLSVHVAGGGRRGYDARLRFNGRAYPGNPTACLPGRLPVKCPARSRSPGATGAGRFSERNKFAPSIITDIRCQVGGRRPVLAFNLARMPSRPPKPEPPPASRNIRPRFADDGPPDERSPGRRAGASHRARPRFRLPARRLAHPAPAAEGTALGQ